MAILPWTEESGQAIERNSRAVTAARRAWSHWINQTGEHVW